ncbi:hypothetical protein GGX14DRAFT_557275 [Mycena pura]|uniref:DUF6534 domain-containing protein n=1 Tax=Mycena pura TaxID=153505 RepID=A0AAD6YN51_9AGAR|nr:hypothetical protein GGX14DRAFT_557275 [Mycena pura]
MASGPDLSSTVGIWLLSVFLESLLHGMGMLQCFLYGVHSKPILVPHTISVRSYFVWYPKDPWSFKATVILIIVLESVQMGASFGNIYDWFINQFGNWDALRFIGWPDMLQLTALYLSVFVAQVHFARCIYHLQKQNIILPAIIFLLALVAVVDLAKLFNAGTAIAADILITFGLCWRLNQGRGGIQSTNKILNFLIMTAINRGGFTVIFAALNIILSYNSYAAVDACTYLTFKSYRLTLDRSICLYD